MITTLQPSEKVDVAVLSGIFSNTTNSYKFLFFQAVLNLILEDNVTSAPIIIPLDEIAVEMLAIGWYPHTFFKLSFGSQDQLHISLDSLAFSVHESTIGNAATQASLRKAIADQFTRIGGSALLRYVPYRLLQPFFPSELARKPDYQKDALTAKLSRQLFASRKPFYRVLDTHPAAIEIHEDWAAYFRASASIIAGWAGFHWINYLQRRNPNVPAIPNKLSAPASRSALTSQTAYWRTIMHHTPVKCLYSGVILDPNEFALDHFLPWSFVSHDQLWNLLPVLPAVNSAKSNMLPDPKYIPCFTRLQTDGLRIAQQLFTKSQWLKATESFVADLRIPPSDLLDGDRIESAYNGTIPALMSLAQQMGFVPGWQFQRRST